MSRRRLCLSLCTALLLFTQTGCWSSKEIEDLAIYAGLALDKGELSPLEKEMEEQGGKYLKRNKITATVQIVPVKSLGGADKQGGESKAHFSNVSETGDSVLEVFRQFSIRRDRPIIGHHLKVVVISSELAKQQKMDQLMDFILRDNDIRPSTMVFLSEGRAVDTLTTSLPNEIPAFHIKDMLRNQIRTSKVMSPVILSEMDALMHSKRSFVLQNIIQAKGEMEFSGAGIIKGETSHWIGNLGQEDIECISWLINEGKSGVIKAYDWRDETITYEIKSMKSKIAAKVDGDDISFEVTIKSEGRLIEDWSGIENPSTREYLDKAEKVFESRLSDMMHNLLQRLQSEYKVEVAGFGNKLSIQHPQVWKKVKDRWDDKFSQIPVTFKIEMKITDFGSSTE